MSVFLYRPQDFLFIFVFQKFESDVPRFLFFVLFVCFFLYQLLVFSKFLRSGVWHSPLILENAQPYISNITPDLYVISSLSRIPIICMLNCLRLDHSSLVFVCFFLSPFHIFRLDTFY